MIDSVRIQKLRTFIFTNGNCSYFFNDLSGCINCPIYGNCKNEALIDRIKYAQLEFKKLIFKNMLKKVYE